MGNRVVSGRRSLTLRSSSQRRVIAASNFRDPGGSGMVGEIHNATSVGFALRRQKEQRFTCTVRRKVQRTLPARSPRLGSTFRASAVAFTSTRRQTRSGKTERRVPRFEGKTHSDAPTRSRCSFSKSNVESDRGTSRPFVALTFRESVVFPFRRVPRRNSRRSANHLHPLPAQVDGLGSSGTRSRNRNAKELTACSKSQHATACRGENGTPPPRPRW